MKIDIIDRGHIMRAANHIDIVGIPIQYVRNEYYVVINEDEYPFKYLVREAYRIATGGQELSFQSHIEYRDFIESLGFTTKHYPEGINFFTKSELDFYNSIANTDYRTDNIQHTHYRDKLAPIKAKVNYWIERVNEEFPEFDVVKQTRWITGRTARISPYMWPRIYTGGDKDIFFNVEVNGEDEFIGFKLDGYTATTNELKPWQKKILKLYKSAGQWTWPRIPFSNIANYDWGRLISETTQYIRNLLDDYDHLKELMSKELKIARITWNTNGWVAPSGRAGKSSNDSFEKENGYGHEEWLFDSGKVIDGMKYGFLEPIHKSYDKYEGGTFDVSLYTIDGYTKKRLWVTTLKDVTVISPEEANDVLQKYQDSGWLDEMKSDLAREGLDANSLDAWIKENQFFNIKFPASQLHDIPEPIEIEGDDIPKTPRYVLQDIDPDTQQTYNKKANRSFSFEDTGSHNADNLSTKAFRQGYTHRPREIELKHNIIQSVFMDFLQAKHGKENVKRECIAHGSARIDIVLKKDTGNILYEIKTYNCLRTSIRESIGQLLEYSLFADGGQINALCIVSDVSPDDSIIEYLGRLKNAITIPISYIQFDAVTKQIILEV